MNEMPAGGPGAPGARRPLWIFVAVAAVCVAQLSWWLMLQKKQLDQLSELKRTQLDYRSIEIALQVSDQVSTLWDALSDMAKDTAWTGSMPRRLLEHPFVLSSNRFPTVTRRIQSPFGHYDLDNWTWIFQGRHDTLWIMLDPTAVARAVELIDSNFEFRGEAPFPGPMPFVLEPSPVRPKASLADGVALDQKQELVTLGVKGAVFLVIILGGVYLIYRRT